MRLLSYRHKTRPGYGVLLKDGVFDLSQRLGAGRPALRDALSAEAMGEIRALLVDAEPDFGLDAILFDPVIPNPDKIICVGRNFADHVEEGKKALTEKPMLFPRYPDAQVGHLEPVVRPFVSDKLDYEGELACVIGRTCRHVAAADALDVIAGYTCFNDGTIRDWQRHTAQMMQGKTFWRSGSMGPWMVTADEISDPGTLLLTIRLNGETVQSSGTDKLIFDIPYLVEYISTITELNAGDIIATGTPKGVGTHRMPPVFLKPGDVLEIEISGVGTLRNFVVDESRPERLDRATHE